MCALSLNIEKTKASVLPLIKNISTETNNAIDLSTGIINSMPKNDRFYYKLQNIKSQLIKEKSQMISTCKKLEKKIYDAEKIERSASSKSYILSRQASQINVEQNQNTTKNYFSDLKINMPTINLWGSQTTSNYNSISGGTNNEFFNNFWNQTGFGNSTNNGFWNFLFKEQTMEEKLLGKIKKADKSGYSVNELVDALNQVGFISDAEANKEKDPFLEKWGLELFGFDIYVKTSHFEWKNNKYIFSEGKCTEIQYANGIVAHVNYDGDKVKNIDFKQKDGKSISIFGEYNKDSDQYGGSQMAMRNNVDELLQDEHVLKILRDAFPGKADEWVMYNNEVVKYDDGTVIRQTGKKFHNVPRTLEEYELYLNKICKTGCGYTAVVNTIFQRYRGKENEFKKTFGFPMYTVSSNGTIDYNYEYLIIDAFTEVWKDSDYTFDDIIDSVRDTEINDGALSGKKDDVSTSTNDKVLEKLSEYLEEKYDISTNMERVTLYDSDDNKGSRKKAVNKIKDLYNDSGRYSQIILSANNWDLYNMDGTIEEIGGGGHAMYITGITDDGDLIVSSWGEEYIVGLDDATRIGYYIIEYT